jgi:hypothetical protein
MNEIVKINPAEYGLEETKAKEIEQMFSPMLSKMTELEGEFNEIVNMPIEKETCKKAKELRNKYVKVRTGTAEIHKQVNDFYLKGGRFVDGWKNAQLFASQGKEEKLEAIEKFFENQEHDRIEKLGRDRRELLLPYTDIMPLALSTMEEMVFQSYLTGVKVAYQARIDAEKKAEADRIANAILDKIASDRREQALKYRQFWTSENYAFREMSEENFNSVIDDLKKSKANHEKEQAKIKAENERLKEESDKKDRQIIYERQQAQKLADKQKADSDAKIQAAREAK